MRAVDLSNKRFGRLVAIAPTERRAGGRVVWRCVCDCGNEAFAQSVHLSDGRRVSCGCAKAAGTQIKMRTGRHGHLRGGVPTPTYITWSGMMSRCFNANVPEFPNYGGRGITACERWRDFANFLADMGERPEGMFIERIDNNGNYEPGNCRWATDLEQHSNRRDNFMLTYKGRTACAAQWARELGFKSRFLVDRISRLGWSVERAIETPILTPSQSAQAANRVRWGGV